LTREPDRHVDAVIGQIDQAVGQIDIQVQVGILRHEPGQPARQAADANRQRRADPQQPGGLGSALTRQRFGIGDICEDGSCVCQKWERLGECHADDIVVTWPDGHETKGTQKLIDDLKALFVFAPDINIKEHPIRFGSGSWTTATGVMTGTFITPMPIGDGKTIAPTGDKFAFGMVTVGHWTNGKMDHEWLYWDNGDFMKQIGLAK
jgi:hypothetical protein